MANHNWPINQLTAVTQEPSVVARQLTPHVEAHIGVHLIGHLKMFGNISKPVNLHGPSASYFIKAVKSVRNKKKK